MNLEQIYKQNQTIIRQNRTLIRILSGKGVKVEKPKKDMMEGFEQKLRSKTYKRP